MYREHQPTIAYFGMKSPENARRVVHFVLATVRTHLEYVPDNLLNPAHMLPASRRGLAYVQGKDVRDWSLRRLLEIPGLGIAKAGFVRQLLHGDVGCLDTHNLKLYGLNARAFRTDCSVVALTERLQTYENLCTVIGTEQLWDGWCEHVAALRPKVWRDAETVSRFHVTCLIP
jgi:hypothetical protein